MLHLIFSLGDDRYALPAGEILEVMSVPLLKALPGTPGWIAGLAGDATGNYPVLDLSHRALGRPSRRVLSTRLALLAYPMPDGTTRRLGVMLERATATLDIAPAAFETLPIGTPESPYLGAVSRTSGGMVQRVSIADLLPPDVSERLFQEPA